MRHAERIKFLIAGMVVIAVSLVAEPVLAQNGLDRITNVYRDGTAAFGPSLRNYAIGLFALLATVEFVWSFASLALKGADFGEFLSEFVTRIMVIMFFYWLMVASGEITPAIVNSFREAGNTAAQAGGGSGGMRPSDIWTAGVDMGSRIMETEVGITDIPKGLALVIAGLVMIVVFALLAALMIIALVESYVVMSAAVLFLGFGGSRWTKDIATKTLIYCVSVGAKLFTVQILVGMAEAMVKAWTNDVGSGGFAEDMGQVLEIIGASIVMLALTFSIPNIVQGMINGSSMGSFNPLTAAAGAVAGGVVGAGALLAGGGMAMSGAAKLASEQLKAADAAGTGPTTGLGRAGALAAGTMSNLAKGSLNDVGQRLAGRVRAGNSPASIGASLHDSAGAMQKERMRPPAPAPFMAPQTANAAPAAAAEGGSIRADAGASPSGPQEGSAPIEGANAQSSGSPDMASGTQPGGTVPGAAANPQPTVGAAPGEPESVGQTGGSIRADAGASPSGPQEGNAPIKGANAQSSGSPDMASGTQPGGTVPSAGATSKPAVGSASREPESVGQTGGSIRADAGASPSGPQEGSPPIMGAQEQSTARPDKATGSHPGGTVPGATATPQLAVGPASREPVRPAANETPGQGAGAGSAVAALDGGPGEGQALQSQTVAGANGPQGPLATAAAAINADYTSQDDGQGGTITGAEGQGGSREPAAKSASAAAAVGQGAPMGSATTVQGAEASSAADPAATVAGEAVATEPAKPQRRRGLSLSDRASGAARDIHGAPPSKPKG